MSVRVRGGVEWRGVEWSLTMTMTMTAEDDDDDDDDDDDCGR